jgi:cathepsin L
MKGVPSPVSVQEIVDCTWGNGSYACLGGTVDDSWWHLIANQIPLYAESDYPYIGVGGICPTMLKNKTYLHPLGNITGCWQTPPDDDDFLKQTVYQFGPVSVSIKAGLDKFVLWQPGDGKRPYDDPDCNNSVPFDHCVLLTGWRSYEEKGLWAWEIQNSWSDLWGDEGYGYIRGGVVDKATGVKHDCGVTNNAYLPDVVRYSST